MRIKQAIDELKFSVSEAYEKELNNIKETEKNNKIIRGHVSPMSTVIENNIALFIQNITDKKYQIFLDSSVSIKSNKGRAKTYRPDLLLVDSHNYVEAMIEIKSNMGYCRNVNQTIQKLNKLHKIFLKEKNLQCSFSQKKDKTPIIYCVQDKNIFLVSFTSQNDGKKTTKKKKYKKDIFMLFDNWYDNPQNQDIEKFAKQIKQITK